MILVCGGYVSHWILWNSRKRWTSNWDLFECKMHEMPILFKIILFLVGFFFSFRFGCCGLTRNLISIVGNFVNNFIWSSYLLYFLHDEYGWYLWLYEGTKKWISKENSCGRCWQSDSKTVPCRLFPSKNGSWKHRVHSEIAFF